MKKGPSSPSPEGLPDRLPSLRWPDLVGVAGGGISAVIGLIALAGWHVQNETLVKFALASAPMFYNTALEFLLCGLGLMGIALRRPLLSAVGGGIAATVGFLTLAQHIFGVNLGIDQLLMKPYLLTEALYPGRMAPLTSLGFWLTGTALFLVSLPARAGGRAFPPGFWRALPVGMGMVTLFICLIGWGLPIVGGAPMDVLTAAGFAALGAGVVVFVWRGGRAEERGGQWLPILVGAGVAMVTVFLWQALTAQESVYIQRMVQLAAAGVKDEIAGRMESRILGLGRMSRHWENGENPDRKQWESDAAAAVRHFPGYRAIGWVDPSLHVRWVAPSEGNGAVRDMDLGLEERQRRALEAARDRREAVLAPSVHNLAQGGRGFSVYIPIFQGERFGGFIAGFFRAQDWLDRILREHIARGYSVTIFDGEEEIYRRDRGDRHEFEKWRQEMRIDLYGASWWVRVWPGPEQMGELQYHTDEMTLVGGLLVALLLALTVHLTQAARLRAKAMEAINRELENEIAERRRVEKALRENQEQTRLIIETSHEAFVAMDADGLIVDWNPQAQATFGWSRPEAVGRPLAPTIIPPQQREAHSRGLHRFLATGEGPMLNKRIEVMAWHRDGREFPVELTMSPVRLGETFVFNSFVHDISERKKAEEAMREAERTQVLAETAIAAAHEIFQPLTAVMGYAEILLAETAPDDPRRGNLENIGKAGKRISEIVNKMKTSRRYATRPYVDEIRMIDFDTAAKEENQEEEGEEAQ